MDASVKGLVFVCEDRVLSCMRVPVDMAPVLVLASVLILEIRKTLRNREAHCQVLPVDVHANSDRHRLIPRKITTGEAGLKVGISAVMI